jgi:hypothetical protein
MDSPREGIVFGGLELTTEQEIEARRIVDNLRAAATVDFEYIAALLASKSNAELFGETEFQVRDVTHHLGRRAFDTALEERKKRGTKGAASCARGVQRMPGLSDTEPAPS